MKTIKIFKNTKPRKRIGIDHTKDKKGYLNFYKGIDINGGPLKGGSIKWDKTPIILN